MSAEPFRVKCRWVFPLLMKLHVPNWLYYWVLDRLSNNNGWRPLSMREAKRKKAAS